MPCILRQPVLDDAARGSSRYEESSSVVADLKKFRTQLAAFDTILWHGKQKMLNH